MLHEVTRMGADTFVVVAYGRTADEAFGEAVRSAQYESGHGGYTGTIAEKHDFVVIPGNGREAIELAKRRIEQSKRRLKEARAKKDRWEVEDARAELVRLREFKKTLRIRMKAGDLAHALIELQDPRIDDKWGPAGCVDLTPRLKRKKRFLFFGWASS